MSLFSDFNKVVTRKDYRFESFMQTQISTTPLTITPPAGCCVRLSTTVDDARGKYTVTTSGGKNLLNNGNIWRYGEAVNNSGFWGPRNFTHFCGATNESITITPHSPIYGEVWVTAYFYKYYKE